MSKHKRTRSAEIVPALPIAELPAQRTLWSGGVLDTSQWLAPNVTETIALGTDAVYSCVRLIADGVSSGSWGQWRGLSRMVPSRLVRRPAATLTQREWTWLVTATMALYGYCPLRLVGGDDSEGVPWSVYPLQPSTLTRIDAGRWAYGSEEIPADELRFVRRTLFPGDALTQGIIRLARAQIAASWAGAEYVADWWGNGGAPQVILTTEQQLAKEQAEDIAARWLERRQLGPSHPAVLGMGTSAQSFGADLMTKDAADAQDRIVASLARYFGVPPHMVNAPNLGASLQYSTTESAGLDLVRYTLGSYSQAIGDVMSELLPGDYLVGQQVRIDLSHLTRAEQLSRYQSWQLAIDGGWMTRDEVRAIEGLAPMAEVDELTVAVNAEAQAAGEQVVSEVMA